MRPKIKMLTYREAQQQAKVLGASIQLFSDRPRTYAAAIKRIPPDGFLILEEETHKWIPAKFVNP